MSNMLGGNSLDLMLEDTEGKTKKKIERKKLRREREGRKRKREIERDRERERERERETDRQTDRQRYTYIQHIVYKDTNRPRDGPGSDIAVDFNQYR